MKQNAGYGIAPGMQQQPMGGQPMVMMQPMQGQPMMMQQGMVQGQVMMAQPMMMGPGQVQMVQPQTMGSAQPMAQATVVSAPGQQGMELTGPGPPTIKQEWQALEALCDVETKNRYRVHGPGMPSGEMYIMENSPCLERICCSVNRSLKLNFHAGSNKTAPIAMIMHK